MKKHSKTKLRLWADEEAQLEVYQILIQGWVQSGFEDRTIQNSPDHQRKKLEVSKLLNKESHKLEVKQRTRPAMDNRLGIEGMKVLQVEVMKGISSEDVFDISAQKFVNGWCPSTDFEAFTKRGFRSRRYKYTNEDVGVEGLTTSISFQTDGRKIHKRPWEVYRLPPIPKCFAKVNHLFMKKGELLMQDCMANDKQLSKLFRTLATYAKACGVYDELLLFRLLKACIRNVETLLQSDVIEELVSHIHPADQQEYIRKKRQEQLKNCIRPLEPYLVPKNE